MRLTQLLDAGARNYRDRIAVVDGEKRITYEQLFERSGRAAGVVRGLGVNDGQRVCILSLNSHRYLELLFGAVWAGGIAAPLNARLAPFELAQIISLVKAEILAVDHEHLELGRELVTRADCLRHLIVLGDRPAPDDCVDYERRLGEVAVPPDAMRGGDDIATLFFTGGTTGLPKGVMQTHTNLVTSALMYVAHWRWDASLVLLGSAPMFHVAAAAVIPPVLMVGGQIVLVPRFEPQAYLEQIERHRVTFANGVPTMFRMILETSDAAKRDLSSVLGMNFGGAPMPVPLLRSLVRTFPNARFYATYGLTEVTSAATVSRGVALADLPDDESDWRTIGRSTPLSDVRVVSADGKECRPGQVGEIVVRGPLVMKGYWENETATAAAIKEGWFHTGDLGTCDQEGRFFLVDRIKDMIITGGENVYSAEVESVIRELGDVADVAVIGLPDEAWGERVHAIIVTRPGASVGRDEILAHCRRRLAGYKCPRSIELQETPLPVSGAGKVTKAVLRQDRSAAGDSQLSRAG